MPCGADVLVGCSQPRKLQRKDETGAEHLTYVQSLQLDGEPAEALQQGSCAVDAAQAAAGEAWPGASSLTAARGAGAAADDALDAGARAKKRNRDPLAPKQV